MAFGCIAVASRSWTRPEPRGHGGRRARASTFEGLCAFADPPRDTAKAAIARLAAGRHSPEDPVRRRSGGRSAHRRPCRPSGLDAFYRATMWRRSATRRSPFGSRRWMPLVVWPPTRSRGSSGRCRRRCAIVGFLGGRHQRRARPEGRRYWTLRGRRDRRCASCRRYDLARAPTSASWRTASRKAGVPSRIS